MTIQPASPLRFAGVVADALRERPVRVVVTGAGGWFGNATLEMLEHALGDRFDDSVAAFASTARDHVLRSGRRIAFRALQSLADLHPVADRPTLVAHYAFLTRERVGETTVEDYVRRNRALTALLATEARRLRIDGLFSTSSGAVYTRAGSIEQDLAANPYGALKVEEEEMVRALGHAIGARTAVCRVFNVAGPFLNKEYALGSLIQCALNAPALTVRAQHRVYRSYAHVADIISVGVAVLLGLTASPGTPYDTSGDVTVEVGALAERVRSLLGYPDKPILRGEVVEGCDDRYVGDGRVFRQLAAQAGLSLAPLDQQILETASYLRSQP